MIRIAVALDKFAEGLEPPGTLRRPKRAPKTAPRVAFTFDWRAAPGSPENTRGIPAAFEVLELEAALARVWPSDAHLVAYVVRGPDGAPLARQPRVNKGSLDWLVAEGYTVACEVLVADVDNPGHGEWTPESMAAARELFDTLPGAPGYYFTRQGARIVQPLARAVPVDEVEAVLEAWLVVLEAHGLKPDRACIDWTRLFRLPHVVRDGRPYRSPGVALERMAPVEPPAPLAPAPKRAATKRAAREQAPAAVPFVPVAPASYDALCRALGGAVYPLVGQRHDTLLALAGALLARRVPPADIPAIIGQVASMAGLSDRVDIEVRGAVDTVDRWMSRLGVTGYTALAKLAPRVAQVVDEHTGQAPPRAEAAPDASLVETTRQLRAVLRDAPDGLTVVRAQCGLGKTAAARLVAAERAARAHATPGPHTRAPLGSRTAISVPTTKLAQQVANDLRAAGVPVRRLFGVLSVLGPDGRTPECSYADTGRALAAGGQSIPFEFCDGRGKEPCELRDSCPAYGGTEGPDEARVVVGTHGQLAQLDALAGATGLLVIDEPPPLLSSVVVHVADLRHAEEQLESAFEPRFSAAIAPALRAVIDWLEAGGAPGDVASVARALEFGVDGTLMRRAFEATGADDALGAARAAFPEGHRGSTAPPIVRRQAFVARRFAALAKSLGRASATLGWVWRGLAHPGAIVMRLELRDETRVLVVTETHAALEAALRREGAVVAMDAGADLHAATYAKVVGYAPPVHAFAARDGAPVTRTLLRVRTATRTGWLARGRLEVGAGLVPAVEAAVRWALESPAGARVGIVSFPVVELALRAALGEDVLARWVAAGQRRAALDEARAALAPLLARLPAAPELGHFGAMRGLDAWSGLDAVITLGDPWPPLGEVQHEVDWLGTGQPLGGWEARAEQLAAAELEQAHGRIRAVHRARPARLLHVGGVLPRGWHDVEHRRPAEGRPATQDTVDPSALAELVKALGGISAAAKLAARDRTSVHRYLVGERPPPPAFVLALVREAEARGVMLQKGLLRGPLYRAFCNTSDGHRDPLATGVLATSCPVHATPAAAAPPRGAACTCGRGPGGGASGSTGATSPSSSAGQAAASANDAARPVAHARCA